MGYDYSVESLCSPDILDRLEDGFTSTHRSQLEAACHLLAYITDALYTATTITSNGSSSFSHGGTLTVREDCTLPPLNWDTPQDLPSDIEWPDDQQDDDDISADDSVYKNINSNFSFTTIFYIKYIN